MLPPLVAKTFYVGLDLIGRKGRRDSFTICIYPFIRAAPFDRFFRSLRGQGRNIDDTLRQIRRSLLEADANWQEPTLGDLPGGPPKPSREKGLTC